MPEPSTPSSRAASSVRPVRSPSAKSPAKSIASAAGGTSGGSGGGGGGGGGGGLSEEVEVVFIESLEKKYECPVCSQVLRYPVQFEECGHRCCSSCLPDLLRVAPRCPIDQTPIDKEKVYVDKAFQNETDNLGVKCSFFARGCSWSGLLKELMSHMETCDRMMTVCPMRCGVEFEKRFLQKHREEDCPKRDIVCQFCETKMIAENEPEHLEICPKFLIPCPNKCKKKEVPREKMQEHLENDCVKQDMACPFSSYGCEFSGKKKQLKEHINENQVTHMEILCAAVKAGDQKREKHETEIKDLEKKLAGLERRIVGLGNLYGAQMVWRIDSYEERLAEAKSGKKSTIFSPPFLTHRHGYKLALSACLYGDGKFRGQFMSVFVCICKGDNDALLPWPFAYKITLQLIDQCEDATGRRNITYAVKPNIVKENRPFLGRPVGERNASFGAARFAELEQLKTLDYIRDDAMFIKVEIDCEEMPPL